jgi:hypothetical protein
MMAMSGGNTHCELVAVLELYLCAWPNLRYQPHKHRAGVLGVYEVVLFILKPAIVHLCANYSLE